MKKRQVKKTIKETKKKVPAKIKMRKAQGKKKILKKRINFAHVISSQKKVAVLMGGPSSEHEVSIKSGLNVLKYLDHKKYQAIPVLIDRRGLWLFNGKNETPLSEPEALLALKRKGVDVAVLALHGEYGEDGFIQNLLGTVDMPFTGSRSLPSALAMNKILSAKRMEHVGLKTPLTYEINRKEWARRPMLVLKDIYNALGNHVVVKPADRGSSVGVSVLEIKNNNLLPLEGAIARAFGVSRRIIAQKAIKGREVTCGVLDIKGHKETLLPTEIIPVKRNFFDFEAKYSGASREVTPPRNMPLRLIKKIEETAVRAHRALGLKGVSRIDMIVAPGNQIFVLEANTIPGMTDASLLPQAARACGISFAKLLDLIIEDAVHGA